MSGPAINSYTLRPRGNASLGPASQAQDTSAPRVNSPVIDSLHTSPAGRDAFLRPALMYSGFIHQPGQLQQEMANIDERSSDRVQELWCELCEAVVTGVESFGERQSIRRQYWWEIATHLIYLATLEEFTRARRAGDRQIYMISTRFPTEFNALIDFLKTHPRAYTGYHQNSYELRRRWIARIDGRPRPDGLPTTRPRRDGEEE